MILSQELFYASQKLCAQCLCMLQRNILKRSSMMLPFTKFKDKKFKKGSRDMILSLELFYVKLCAQCQCLCMLQRSTLKTSLMMLPSPDSRMKNSKKDQGHDLKSRTFLRFRQKLCAQCLPISTKNTRS